MAIYKCKMCGGDLEILPGTTVCECEYCGTQQTVPSADSEKLMNLYNRANRLRFNNEFDKAAGVFESIVAEFPEEAEAYWGLCLCKYGIEYVDDPATAKKIPTCHRTSFDSIFEDSNFELALEYADVVANKLYREEAKEIDRIQRSILNIVKSEEPYDIFICYKETAPDGQRTKDSVMAQDIYDALVAKGYKVFFARITLEDKLGQEYEPYIFAALSSAKIMLSISTCYENFNAVWVKNEWSRFLAMMKDDKSKVLIPCYCDCDAYDMPQEFKNLQGQDMGKVGFIQDLVRGIGKIVTAPADQVNSGLSSATSQIQTVAPSRAENLLKRGMLCLEKKQWDDANNFFEQVLEENVEEARAYIGKLLCICQITNEEELIKWAPEGTDPLTDYSFFDEAYRFADEEYKKHLDELQTKFLFSAGMKMFNKAVTEEEYLDAQYMFEQIIDYPPAKEKYDECSTKATECAFSVAQERFDSAKSEYDFLCAKACFDLIKDYKPACDKSIECEVKAMDCVYNNADKILSESRNIKELSHAKQEFERIAEYKDASDKATQCDRIIQQIENDNKDAVYNRAKNLLESGEESNIRSALSYFKQIEGWKDTNQMISECQTRIQKIDDEAEQAHNERKAEIERKAQIESKRARKRKVIVALCVSAVVVAGIIALILNVIMPYQNNLEKYNKAAEMLSEENYDQARIEFEALGDFKDSPIMIKETDYQKALAMKDICSKSDDYLSVIDAFTALGNYKDSTDLRKSLQYEYACYQIENKDYLAAISVLEDIPDYKDDEVAEKCSEAKYGYVKSHQSPEDNTTYQFLKELVSEDYPGAQYTYDSLYKWNAEVYFNTSNISTSRQTSLSKWEKWFIHINITNSFPEDEDDGYAELWVKITFPDGYTQKEYKTVYEPSTISFTASYTNPQYCMAGILRVAVYDGDDLIANGSIKITD